MSCMTCLMLMKNLIYRTKKKKTRRIKMSSMDDLQVGAGISKKLTDDFIDYNIEQRKPPKHNPILALIEDNFALEALDNFIIVQEDKFRTGYECKACDGEGHGTTVCPSCNGSKTQTVTNKCPNCLGSGKEK